MAHVHSMQSFPDRSPRRLSLTGFGLGWCCGFLVLTFTAAAQAQVTQAQIDSTVTRARTLLIQQGQIQIDGYNMIGAIALLKSGSDHNAPEITRVVDRILKRINDGTYELGGHHYYEAAVALITLSNIDKKKFKPQIESIARVIIAGQAPTGYWHYPHQNEGDTSISQYAILALWEADLAGVDIPKDVWDRAASWHLSTQLQDGSWAYHPQGTGNVIGGQGLHSMTAAGIGSLSIIKRELFPDFKDELITEPDAPTKKKRFGPLFGMLEPVVPPVEVAEGETLIGEGAVPTTPKKYVPRVRPELINQAILRGSNWMTRNFTVTNPTGYHIYFLYGLERASALAGITTYGNRDWYQEGADYLVKHQTANGSWVENSGEYSGAAFGVLFLVKATAKSIQPRAPRTEFGSGILVGGRGLPSMADADKQAQEAAQAGPKSSLEDLLKALEQTTVQGLETTQTEIVEHISLANREELVGQIDRLKQLARHPQPEVRRTAMWALGRSADLRVAPLLLKGLQEDDLDIFVEARNGLRCLSRQIDQYAGQAAPLDKASREKEYEYWKKWYLQVRPYEERDDLPLRRQEK